MGSVLGAPTQQSFSQTSTMRPMFAATLLLVLPATLAVQLERKPFKRLIPADVLRDFRDSCFASTKCKVYAADETWSLAPFCGQSKCVKLKSGRLAEEVTDCGPVVDLKKTPGCQLLKGEADPKADYPDCCPVYDCEEGTEVVYVTPPSTKKDEKKDLEGKEGGVGSN